MKIGIISDSHGFLHGDIDVYLNKCDEIWHAGDIGSIEILNKLENFKKIRAVYGNIDDEIIRREVPEFLTIKINKLKFLLIHIAGIPPRYNKKTLELIKKNKPDVIVCGHSHILKIIKDSDNNLLFINPGACGKIGFHKKKTIVRFDIINDKIKNLEVIELK